MLFLSKTHHNRFSSFTDPKTKRSVFEIVDSSLHGVQVFLPSDRSWLDILSNIFAIGLLILQPAFRLPGHIPNLAIGSDSSLAFVAFPENLFLKRLLHLRLRSNFATL
jgi:hypothetical protein